MCLSKSAVTQCLIIAFPRIAMADHLSVCQAVRRAARGRLQLHTYAHNMQTKNLKALCYKAAWLAPIDSLVQNQLAPLLFILDKK